MEHVAEEQQKIRRLLRRALGKHKKPTMALEDLRRMLDAQLGDRSLSEEIIKMRQEGY